MFRNLGAYFSSLPYNATPSADAAQNPELTAKGKSVATRNHCATCHMENYRGSGAAAAIADQREDYLAKALKDYRSAARPSTGVAAMNEAASALSDDDIVAVAHYLATLPSPRK